MKFQDPQRENINFEAWLQMSMRYFQTLKYNIHN